MMSGNYTRNALGQGLSGLADALKSIQAMKMDVMLKQAQMAHDERMHDKGRSHEKDMVRLQEEMQERSHLLQAGFLTVDDKGKYVPNFHAYAEHMEKLNRYNQDMLEINKRLAETNSNEAQLRWEILRDTKQAQIDTIKEQLNMARASRYGQQLQNTYNEYRNKYAPREFQTNIAAKEAGIAHTEASTTGLNLENMFNQGTMDYRIGLSETQNKLAKLGLLDSEFNLGKKYLALPYELAKWRQEKAIGNLDVQDRALAHKFNTQTFPNRVEQVELETEGGRLSNEAQKINNKGSEIDYRIKVKQYQEFIDTAPQRLKAMIYDYDAPRLRNEAAKVEIDTAKYNLETAEGREALARAIMEQQFRQLLISNTGAELENAERAQTSQSRVGAQNAENAATKGMSELQVPFAIDEHSWKGADAEIRQTGAVSELQNMEQEKRNRAALNEILNTLTKYKPGQPPTVQTPKEIREANPDKYSARTPRGTLDILGIANKFSDLYWSAKESGRQKADLENMGMEYIKKEQERRAQILQYTIENINRKYGSNITVSQVLQDPAINPIFASPFLKSHLTTPEWERSEWERMQQANGGR